MLWNPNMRAFLSIIITVVPYLLMSYSHLIIYLTYTYLYITYIDTNILSYVTEEQEFRLTRNEEYGEGVLEAFFEDHWFQFNAEYWNEEAAVVACRTLGFKWVTCCGMHCNYFCACMLTRHNSMCLWVDVFPRCQHIFENLNIVFKVNIYHFSIWFEM